VIAAKGAPPGFGSAPRELSSLGGVDLQASIPNQAPSQKENCASEITCAALRRPQTMGARRHLRLVPQPPRPRRLEARIAVADGRSPIGRTRLFRLSERNLQELIETAKLREARA
jgi:hypothetical protein